MPVDYHTHPLAHGEYAHSKEHLSLFFEQARKMGLKEIGLADHDRFREDFCFETIKEAARSFPDLQVRVGIEVDYIPGKIEKISQLVDEYPWDFVIGSVHFIDGWGFDNPDEIRGYEGKDPDELYSRYYDYLAEAIQSKLFDIIGHFDLIKIFNLRPKEDPVKLAQKALDAAFDAGVCVEINTAGRYKPVGEMYPEKRLLQACYERGVPITLSSDAHHPAHVGRDIDQAKALARRVGYHKAVRFSARQKDYLSFSA